MPMVLFSKEMDTEEDGLEIPLPRRKVGKYIRTSCEQAASLLVLVLL